MATPFGNFITAGVQSSLGSFSNTADIALGNTSGNQPSSDSEGHHVLYDEDVNVYYTPDAATLTSYGIDATSVTFSTSFPEDYSPADGDVYYYGDYMYSYNQVANFNADGSYWWDEYTAQDAYGSTYPWDTDGWGVRVVDRTKSSYGVIADTLFGAPVDNLCGTFAMCTNLVDASAIVIPDSVNYLAYTFSYCSSLTSIPSISASLWNQSYRAFLDCTSLTSVTVPVGTTSISNDALKWCTNLESITFTGTTAEWNAIRKMSGWNSNTGIYTVTCTDGTVAKDGTVTLN